MEEHHRGYTDARMNVKPNNCPEEHINSDFGCDRVADYDSLMCLFISCP